MGAVLLGLIAVVAPVNAQGSGVSVTCDNGAQFDNGVEVVVSQMRTGFNYTATAIGLNGFDPVLAVLDETRAGFCEDDVAAAAQYQFNLPTTGNIAGNNLSSQVSFSASDPSGFADISLVVGGFDNTAGEFLLILEGMGVTSGDGAGDPFSMRLTPGIIDSGEPVYVYMLSRGQVDPLIHLATSGFSDFAVDGNNARISCDDSGNADLCWGQSFDLSGSTVVTTQGRINGSQYNAMLTLPVSDVQLDPDPNLNFLNMLFTSYENQTTGQYILAFHVTTTAAGAPVVKNDDPIGSDPPQPEQPQQQQPAPPSSLPAGISVTCDNGAQFDNGVEVIVNQMRTGFNYTATAVGINGFDPVLAVLDETRTGFCEDDVAAASVYQANLPTSGNVAANGLSSQVTFSASDPSGFADISLVVGGFGNTAGEFLLFLEGMGVTSGDGAGDPFSIRVTPGMVASGQPVAVYMLSRGQVDPLMAVATTGFNGVAADNNGDAIRCDDAGNAELCWGASSSLANSTVTTSQGRISGSQYNAMLNLPLAGYQMSPNPDENIINLLFASYEYQTTGQYVLVFHVTTAGNFAPDA
jgi:hypothetical protein